MTAPTCGRIVHYRLSAADVERVDKTKGNRPAAGDTVPLIVVRVWDNEYPPGVMIANLDGPKFGVHGDGTPGGAIPYTYHHPHSPYGVNGQAILDGPDSLWVTSAPEGDWPGSWSWPPHAAERTAA